MCMVSISCFSLLSWNCRANHVSGIYQPFFKKYQLEQSLMFFLFFTYWLCAKDRTKNSLFIYFTCYNLRINNNDSKNLHFTSWVSGSSCLRAIGRNIFQRICIHCSCCRSEQYKNNFKFLFRIFSQPSSFGHFYSDSYFFFPSFLEFKKCSMFIYMEHFFNSKNSFQYNVSGFQFFLIQGKIPLIMRVQELVFLLTFSWLNFSLLCICQ